MKKLYSILLFISIQSYSQDFAKQVLINDKTASDDKGRQFEVVIKTNNSYSEGNMTHIPAAVLSAFTNNYQDASHVSCLIADNLCTLTFVFYNQTMIVKYKSDGSQISMRKTYSGDKVEPMLSAFLATEVSSSYKIKYVTELQQEGSRSYNINFSNDKDWLNLKIVTDKITGQLQVVGRVLSSTQDR